MDYTTIDILRSINDDFYRAHHESFSQSRRTGWPGWERLLDRFREAEELNLLDVACGNMRFERFLIERLAGVRASFTCVDNCEDLVERDIPGCKYFNVDIVSALANNGASTDTWGLPQRVRFDSAVSFGFMHHIPSLNLRLRFLEILLDAVETDGFVAVSLWRFASDEKMRLRALRTTAEALATFEASKRFGDKQIALEEGDYFIGWNEQPGAYRYCHSFSDFEVDWLIDSLSTRALLVDRYRADGRTGELNEYLVFRRCGF